MRTALTVFPSTQCRNSVLMFSQPTSISGGVRNDYRIHSTCVGQFNSNLSEAEPLEHRPISLCSQRSRVHHKVLASRFEKLVHLSVKQNGFKKLDDVGANLTLAKSLINYAKYARRSISLCFIDVKKAFDSVSRKYACSSETEWSLTAIA